MLCVGLLADGAGWESQALALLEATSGMTVLKRCVDVDDLMASVTTGQFDVAVVTAGAEGLDHSAVAHVGRHGCAVVAVVDGGHPELVPQRLARAGVEHVLEAAAITELPTLVRAVHHDGIEGPTGRAPRDAANLEDPGVTGPPAVAPERGRVLVVWGPAGAPGRTTVATGLAGLLAARGRPTIIVDADRHASVAQHLGVMDQVSGVLAASRLWTSGALTGRINGSCRALSPALGVLTGVPRPDRRDEVPAGALIEVVEEIATFADVVIDLGHDLDAEEPPGSPGCWSIELLEAADDVVVVGAADPVGLTRLAHALVDLRDACGDLNARVVVNRTRPTLGWSEKDMAEVIGRFAPVGAMHFLPDDRAAVDRALVAGAPATERPSALSTAIGAVLNAVRPETVEAVAPMRGMRRGRVGRSPTVPGPRSPAARESFTLRTAGRDRQR